MGALARQVLEEVDLAPDLVIKAELGPSPWCQSRTCALCPCLLWGRCIRIVARNAGGTSSKRGYPQYGICHRHTPEEIKAQFDRCANELLDYHLRADPPKVPRRPPAIDLRLVPAEEPILPPAPEPKCSVVYWSPRYWYFSVGKSRAVDDHVRPAQRTLCGIFERVEAVSTQMRLPGLSARPPEQQTPERPSLSFNPALLDVNISSADAASAIIDKYTPAKRRDVQIAVVCGFQNLYEGIVRELATRGHFTSVHIDAYRKRKICIPNADTYVILSHAAGSHAIVQQIINHAKRRGAAYISTPFKTPSIVADAAINSLGKGSGVNLRVIAGGAL